MATTRTFSDMLNDYLPNELLKEELQKRNYVLNRVEKDDNWKSGPLIVPFKAAGASSVSYGALTASNDVAEDKYVRGQVDAPAEVWGTMIFNHRDIMEHDKISEQNFLKILPDTVDDFIDYMKNVVSTNLLNGAAFAKLTVAATANDGLIIVDRPDRFVIGQKVKLVDGDSDITGYVSTINMNTSTVLMVTARGGATPLDFSGAENLDVGASCYNDGADTAAFSSIKGALLSLANGGTTNLYGVAKTAYPYLQAINVDGSGVTATNILEEIFKALVVIRKLGKGNPTEVLMSYTNFGYAMAMVENSKGSFNVVPNSVKTSVYGWTEIMIGSVTGGTLKLVAVQEADDDAIMFIDWRAIKFYSNGFFRKRKSPNGIEYFEVRNTSGFQYLVDICCFGDIVVQRPSYCGILHTISIPA